jgi:hypothetical protein
MVTQMIMDDELVRVWKEAVVIYFKGGLYPSICLEELWEGTRNRSQCNWNGGRESNTEHPE